MYQAKFKFFTLCILLLSGLWFTGNGIYIQAKAMLAQVLLEQAWKNTLSGEIKSKPWPWADTWPVARMRVPRLDIDLIILAGDSGRTLAFGPGHNFASADPGQTGNSLISAHRDTHFEFLQHLNDGDSIYIDTRSQLNKHFKVSSSQIVNMQNTILVPEENAALLHLVTCYPFDSLLPGGEQRFIVSAIEQNERRGPLFKTEISHTRPLSNTSVF